MRSTRRIAAAAMALTCFGGWWLIGLLERDKSIAIGSTLPEFSLTPVEGLDGSGFDSSVLEGHFSLLNAFASWCVPCRNEHPLLVEIAQKYEVRLLGMNVADLPENAAAFLEKLGNPYALVGGDPDKSVAGKLGLVGLPHTFLLDPDGKLLVSHPGPVGRDFIDRILPKLAPRRQRP